MSVSGARRLNKMIPDTSASITAYNPISMTRVKPSPGSLVICQHCDDVVFSVVNDTIIITGRHHGNHHKSVVSLRELGFIRIA